MAFGSLNGHGDDAPMSEINVTPLVDVMLVLLIVFMITMPVLTHTIPISLPTASEQAKPAEEPKDPLRLTIDRDGAYYLGDKQTSPEALAQTFVQAKTANPDTILAIDADKDTAYDAVAQALNMAKDAGLAKVGFVTEKRAD
ncbi:biopolymer transporter ExbD [Neisseria leonii]|uniref:Biopolymer transporter ExbD n=1 Tax=Neisseria leonii TaxID=2995413 RepID=A0A9X4E638_9NEIS|nr:biopolymer transporter ExbD [Neisseria sp. 51.81]MDD9328082.1 biopolymer transporter ExbD [Neisseria sp. 51.81]